MRTGLISAAVFLSFVLVASACKGDNTTTTTPSTSGASPASASGGTPAPATSVQAGVTGPPSICSFLTAAQVGGFIGETVVNATPGGVDCSFAGAGFDVVNIAITGLGNDAAAAKQSFQQAKQNGATDVSGFGEAAYWFLGNDPNSLAFRVLKNNRALTINVYTSRGKDPNLTSAEQVANVLVPHMP